MRKSTVRALLLGTGMLCLGWGGARGEDAAVYASPTPAQEQQVENLVGLQLRDPGSAQYEAVRVYVSQTQDGGTFCGVVNAKNAFGGYVGRRPFFGFWIGDKGLAVLLAEDPTWKQIDIFQKGAIGCMKQMMDLGVWPSR